MIPGQMSIFTGGAKVKPGTFVQFSPKTGGSVRDVTYWSVVDCIASGGRDQFRGDLQDAVDATGSLLADTVKRQMISDVPVGAFLSGGIDSSLVTALMRNNSTQPIHTYCIGFAEDNYNEAQHAAKIAQYLETDHTEFLLTPEDVLGIIPDLHLISDEPFADSSQVPTALLCRLTKGHVKVALSGDGGDEIFGGYTQYLSTQKISALLNYGPPFLKRLGARALHALPASTWETLLTLPGRDQPLASGEKMYLLAEILAAPKDQLHRALYSRWRDMEAILPGVEEPDDPFSAPDLVAAAPNLLDRLMGVDIQYGLPDRMLTKVDRASMASSLEVRVPLLDHRLVEFAWRLPQKMKMSHGVGKHVLRQLLYRSVPQSLVDRPKQGFSFPLAEWLRGPLKPWAQNLLSKDAIRSNGLLVPATIDLVWQQHLSGSRNHHNLIWHVLMLQSWCNGQKTLGR